MISQYFSDKVIQTNCVSNLLGFNKLGNTEKYSKEVKTVNSLNKLSEKIPNLRINQNFIKWDKHSIIKEKPTFKNTFYKHPPQLTTTSITPTNKSGFKINNLLKLSHNIETLTPTINHNICFILSARNKEKIKQQISVFNTNKFDKFKPIELELLNTLPRVNTMNTTSRTNRTDKTNVDHTVCNTQENIINKVPKLKIPLKNTTKTKNPKTERAFRASNYIYLKYSGLLNSKSSRNSKRHFPGEIKCNFSFKKEEFDKEKNDFININKDLSNVRLSPKARRLSDKKILVEQAKNVYLDSNDVIETIEI